MENDTQQEQPQEAKPVDDPNLPEEGDNPDQFEEEPIPPGEIQDEESASQDDTVDDNENDTAAEPVNDPATNPPVEAPATTPQPGSGQQEVN